MKNTIKMTCLGIALLTLGSNFSSMAVGHTCLAHCAADCAGDMKCFDRFCSICYDQKEMTHKPS